MRIREWVAAAERALLRSGYPRSTPQLKSSPVKPSRDISRLIEIMAALRTPESGCPWDLEQNFRTIAPYTLEEAYEVADAIARNDLAGLKDELGDLLLQVVFHARMAQEQGAFDFADVIETITSQADPPASARFRRCRRQNRKGRRGPVGADQGRGKGRTRRGSPKRRTRRGAACPTRVNTCLEAAGQGRTGWL